MMVIAAILLLALALVPLAGAVWTMNRMCIEHASSTRARVLDGALVLLAIMLTTLILFVAHAVATGTTGP